MSNDLQKYISADESSDPNAIANRQDDDEFLSMYRSLNVANATLEHAMVQGSVEQGVIPDSVRYGVMRRGNIEVYRGVVKSTAGDLFYLSWAPDTGADVHLVKADNDEKKWDADRFFKTCKLGCDLRKSEAPLDPGQTVEQSTKDDEDGTTKDGVPAATATISEDQSIAEQQSLITDKHPGDTASAMPDDESSGRNWHGEEMARSQTVTRPGDGAALDTGAEHWSAVDLLKAWGQKMQRTAPRVGPQVSDLEQRYLTEVMGVSADEVRKGVALPPRHRLGFQQWKAEQLRGKLTGLESFLRGTR